VDAPVISAVPELEGVDIGVSPLLLNFVHPSDSLE
jgi:hypothetical protein